MKKPNNNLSDQGEGYNVLGDVFMVNYGIVYSFFLISHNFYFVLKKSGCSGLILVFGKIMKCWMNIDESNHTQFN